LEDKNARRFDRTAHPYVRKDRFFDSSGPGGTITPRPDYFSDPLNGHGPDCDLEIDRRSFIPFAHYGYVYCMLMTNGEIVEKPGENVLITGGGDGSIKLWSLSKRGGGRPEELFELGVNDGSEESVLSIALDESFLVSGKMGGQIDVWDLETRQLVRTLHSRVDDVRSLTVGSNYLFAGGSNGMVEVRGIP
jgi:di- and tripeptidase